jgi:hypothetical protein
VSAFCSVASQALDRATVVVASAERFRREELLREVETLTLEPEAPVICVPMMASKKHGNQSTATRLLQRKATSRSPRRPHPESNLLSPAAAPNGSITPGRRTT